MTDEIPSGIPWLGGHKGWWQVSREERFFCAELYRIVHGQEPMFVEFLNKERRMGLDESADWELAYEVCFYRDWNQFRETQGHDPEPTPSTKRTFDLVLFSALQVVLFEAKAQQPYDLSQLCDLRRDREAVLDCIRQSPGVVAPKILTLGIKSSRYRPRDSTLTCFNFSPINWCELAKWCTWDLRAQEVFGRADWIYRDR